MVSETDTSSRTTRAYTCLYIILQSRRWNGTLAVVLSYDYVRVHDDAGTVKRFPHRALVRVRTPTVQVAQVSE